MLSVQPLAQAQNVFATDLYAKLRGRPGNLFFSPYSVAMAIDMVFVGANGGTEAEIAKALHLDRLQTNVADTSLRTALLRQAKQRGLFDGASKDGLEIHVANALWGKAGYPFNAEYKESIRDSFAGNFEPLDFGNEPSARDKINGWVSNQTADKIQNIIGSGVLNAETRLVLTNAIYFKAAWGKKFQKIATQKETFRVSANKNVSADMMRQTGFFKLASLAGFRLLSVPYKYDEASMLILLPDRVDGLPDIEASLTAENLESWIEKGKTVSVALSLPKFKNTSAFSLREPLETLGMRKSFAAGQADFLSIANVRGDPLFVGAVLHKAFVDVDEEGTEAAAATAVVMVGTAMVERGEPEPFVADHPFLYIIRANRTGDILFMGRLTDPTQQGG